VVGSARERALSICSGVISRNRAQRMGETKIQKFNSMLRQKHVGRFQIAVHKTLSVQRVQRGQNAQPDLNRRRQIDGPARNTLRQRLSFEQFHYQEELSTGLSD